MKNSEVSPNNSKWFIFILRNIILVAIILIAAKFLFDDSPSNDNIGWLALVVFWTLKSLFDFIEDRKDGKKKSAIANLIFIAVGFGILLWKTISFLPF
ncbi:MAG: hypothetical protein ACQEWF_18275 [Bacillota bacterium]